MCGIVGLFLKNPKLENSLGRLLTPMLVEMTERGPDSAGIAIYAQNAGDTAKLTVQSATPDEAFDGLADKLGTAIGAKATIERRDSHAVLSMPREKLDAALDAEPTAVSRVEHTRAVASMPTAEAKEFAFERFTGAVAVPNYELRAAGQGMWREAQAELLTPYVARYADQLPTAARAHSGWVQADVAEDFFPACMADDEAMALLAPLRTSDDLPAPVRRRVTDAVDELERRRAVIARFRRG